MKSVLLLLLATTAVYGFAPRSMTMRRIKVLNQAAASVPLNQVDEMCIEDVADFCLEEAMECDVEEFEALINQLTQQRAYHASQVALIDDLLVKLSARSVDSSVVNGSVSP